MPSEAPRWTTSPPRRDWAASKTRSDCCRLRTIVADMSHLRWHRSTGTPRLSRFYSTPAKIRTVIIQTDFIRIRRHYTRQLHLIDAMWCGCFWTEGREPTSRTGFSKARLSAGPSTVSAQKSLRNCVTAARSQPISGRSFADVHARSFVAWARRRASSRSDSLLDRLLICSPAYPELHVSPTLPALLRRGY